MTPTGVLHFQRGFYPRIRNGTKTMTTRHRAHGKPGDILMVPDLGYIRLIKVQPMTLGTVARLFWRESGTDSPTDYVDTWNRLYTTRPFREYDVGISHRFVYLGETPP